MINKYQYFLATAKNIAMPWLHAKAFHKPLKCEAKNIVMPLTNLTKYCNAFNKFNKVLQCL